MITPVLLTVAALLALLWLLGVGVESIWDQRRYAWMAATIKAENACVRFFRTRPTRISTTER